MGNMKVAIYFGSKDNAMVKFQYVKSQGQGHKVKIFGTNKKVSPQGIHIFTYVI